MTLKADIGDLEITGLTADSRAVKPGFLFAALPGSNVDGRSFITAAIDNGAAAVLAPEDTNIPEGTPLIAVSDARATLAHMAAAFYADQPHTIAAVTGTNGKTSVAHFTRQIWTALGNGAASLGTLGRRCLTGR